MRPTEQTLRGAYFIAKLRVSCFTTPLEALLCTIYRLILGFLIFI